MAANDEMAKLLRGGVVTGPLDSVDAVVVESRELQNSKRYTVWELLASDEAMKDLLHERLLAVRDDLNFAINACNPSAAVGQMTRRVAALENAVQGLQSQVASILRGQEFVVRNQVAFVAQLERIEKKLDRQPRWWARWQKKMRGV